MIGQTGFIALSQALRENKVLLILNMSEYLFFTSIYIGYNLVNEFESDWATELGTALEENITLEHLKLSMKEFPCITYNLFRSFIDE